MRRFLYQPKGRANETHAFIAGRDTGLYAINHASGCSHGCTYPCYAQKRQETLRGRTYDDWRKPKVYTEAPEVARKELDGMIDKGRHVKDVELCFTTDPFMFGNATMIETSNELIEILSWREIGVTVLTKGSLLDANAGEALAEVSDIKYGISLVSLDEAFRMEYEPGAAPFKTRVAGLKQKHEEGHKTWVSIEPFPPHGLRRHSVEEILRAIPFVDKAIFGRWNYSVFTAHENYKPAASDFERTCLELGIEGKVKDDI